ncbi:hypothetical protein GCM10009789_71660 [Kribbella sancticallisti]|uniref:Lanthionine synthetase C-like protein n=1 Tax=Kribbella sancticallisti TaxID=460087 RepID=A0ABP4QCZ1_9ACTN
MLRKLLVGVAVLATLDSLVATARLVLPRADPEDSAVKQLRFLRGAIEGGADHDAQRLFPEGYFFLNVLYGLTWVQVGLAEPARTEDALREARWSLDRVQSPAGTAPFDPALTPRYGVFHAGWTNWLRGAVLALQPADSRDTTEFTRGGRREW